MSLSVYKKKRKFNDTPEPGTDSSTKAGRQLAFVVQEHHASHLHYDFRLEWNGVLKSWAVPKGPSMDPADKRLAVLVEDHPYNYKDFEGNIPEGNYGAGSVAIWDQGNYMPEEAGKTKKEKEKQMEAAFRKGKISFVANGEKLKGLFTLVKTGGAQKNTWLLIKSRDEYTETKKASAKKSLVTPARKKTPAKTSRRKTIREEKWLDRGKKQQVKEVDGKELKFTNPQKIYWPKEKISKGDMIDYYHSIAPYILPYLQDRPHSLNRHPDGVSKQGFYQKNMTGKFPSWLQTLNYKSTSVEGRKKYLVCEGEATLLYMANLGCIEINPWHSRVQSTDKPDWCVIDLDPDTNPFSQVVEAAQMVKQVLDSVSVKGYAKTSGSTGIHIFIPLGANYDYDQSKTLAELVVSLVHRELPRFTSLERNPAKRKGKIYLDFLQNRPTQTIAAPYSLRPKPGATVSMPLEWEEVKKGLQVKDFTIKNTAARIKEKGDPFTPVLGKGILLEKVLKKMEQL